MTKIVKWMRYFPALDLRFRFFSLLESSWLKYRLQVSLNGTSTILFPMRTHHHLREWSFESTNHCC